ncbi:galectin-3b [Denticeps clupeoides]|uniref:Galectin n=1 Tax=Denticeps clupeoides TaxID=299321 RepID=A0AAY3ZUH5_9TELE|nr:galectin-3-like [Denticeps clupeoides]
MDLSDALEGETATAGATVSDQPMWPGQPNQPMWPGQPNQPMWPGQPGQPNQPTWPGQPNQPMWPGQPAPNPPTAPQFVPQQPLTVPYVMNLPNGCQDKMLITITGQVKPNANVFAINLTKGNDIAFHFNPRFNHEGKNVIVRNAMVGTVWGAEERESSSFPFAPGRNFEIKILCTPNEFKVAVDKSHLLEFKHRIKDLTAIKGLGIYNDVTLTSVFIEQLQ